MAALEDPKPVPKHQLSKELFDKIVSRLSASEFDDIDTHRLIAVRGNNISGILEIHLDDAYLILEHEIGEPHPVVELQIHAKGAAPVIFNQEDSATLAEAIMKFYRKESAEGDINFIGIGQYESQAAQALEEALKGALDHEAIKNNNGWVKEATEDESAIIYKKSILAVADAGQRIDVTVSRAAGAEIWGCVPLECVITVCCSAVEYTATINDEIAWEKFNAIVAAHSS